MDRGVRRCTTPLIKVPDTTVMETTVMFLLEWKNLMFHLQNSNRHSGCCNTGKVLSTISELLLKMTISIFMKTRRVLIQRVKQEHGFNAL